MAPLIIISACGGGSTSDEANECNDTQSDCSVPVYIVDSVVSSGGNIDKPISEVVNGDSVDLILMPHTDQRVSNVTGCDGQLSELTYSTGAIFHDCTVNVVFTSLFPEAEPPLARVRIPVVFHILDRGLTDVSDEEIISQIEITNQHFRRYNLDELDSLSDEHKPFVADMGIQFYLADRDPEGNPHNGIVRVDTNVSAFDLEYKFAQSEFGGSAPWPNDRYINIWVGDSRELFGGIGLPGRAHIPTLSPDEYIGVSVEESVVGIIDPQVPELDQGKTLTHELAHFLGLIGHTHGVISDKNNHAHLACDGNENTSCKNSDLLNNFMNVTVNDEGMKMFSLSQQQVMRDWLETGPLTALYQNSLVQ